MNNIEERRFKEIIARRIKEIRKSLNISQENLAEKANISEDTVSKIEREGSIINSITLVKLCNALNVTPNDILEEFIDIKPIGSQLNKKFLTLSDEEKKYFLGFIDFINSIKKSKN